MFPGHDFPGIGTGWLCRGESVGEKRGGVEEREESADDGKILRVDSIDEVGVGDSSGTVMALWADVPIVLGMKSGARRSRFAGGSSRPGSSLTLQTPTRR